MFNVLSILIVCNVVVTNAVIKSQLQFRLFIVQIFVAVLRAATGGKDEEETGGGRERERERERERVRICAGRDPVWPIEIHLA